MLCTRPLRTRLAVAYMASAYYARIGEPFLPCNPGSTITRLYGEFRDGFNGVKPSHDNYASIWESIGTFYDAQGWDELCDAELNERAQAAMSVGFTAKDGNFIPSADLLKHVQYWAQRGWFRYEQRRNGRRNIAYRFIPYAALAVVTGGASLTTPNV